MILLACLPDGFPGLCFYLLTQLSFSPLYLCFSVKPSFSLFFILFGSCTSCLKWRRENTWGLGEADLPNWVALLLLMSSGEIQLVPKMAADKVLTSEASLLGLWNQGTGWAASKESVISQSGGRMAEIKVSRDWFPLRPSGAHSRPLSGFWCFLAMLGVA